MTMVPITKENLSLLAKAAAKFGMPRSEGWLRRTMFDPTVEDLVSADTCRGHMALYENGEVAAVQGYYYQPCYFKQQKILGNTGCIMGADARVGEELLCVLDKNRETTIVGQLGFGNEIANKRSAKVNKVVCRLQPAPYRAFEHRVGVADVAAYPVIALNRLGVPGWLKNLVWLILRPLAWLVWLVKGLFVFRGGYSLERCMTTQVEGIGDFWERFLASNTGVISSREPARLRWLFEDSIKAGVVHMIVARKAGRVEGYVLIRQMPDESTGTGWAKGFEVVDICAVGNEVICLRALAEAALRLTGTLHGIKLVFYGYMSNQEKWVDPVFRVRIEDDHPYFMYGSRRPEIKESLQKNEGWFFGPLDGERCMGGGGYVDL